MVVSNNVKAYLARYIDGKPYTEHAVPTTARNYTANPNERYIEAVTDERFEIHVVLMPGFDFMKSPRLRITYWLDKGNGYCSYISKKGLRQDRIARVTRVIDGQQMFCALTFGELVSDEDMDMSKEQLWQEFCSTGRVVVSIDRGQPVVQEVERREESQMTASEKPDDFDTSVTAEKLVAKHNVSHAVKHVPLAPSSQPSGSSSRYQQQWVSAKGAEGEAITFIIRYRSRQALIAQGIIDDDDAVEVQDQDDGATTDEPSDGISNAPQVFEDAKPDDHPGIPFRPQQVQDASSQVQSGDIGTPVDFGPAGQQSYPPTLTHRNRNNQRVDQADGDDQVGLMDIDDAL